MNVVVRKEDFLTPSNIVKFHKMLQEINEPFDVLFDCLPLRIPSNAFANTKVSSILFPESITSIDSFAFSNCKDLYFIAFPNSVKLIDHLAFTDCPSLNFVFLPNSIDKVFADSFANCAEFLEFYINKSERWFLSNVVGATPFLDKYKSSVCFKKAVPIDDIISNNNTIESIFNILAENN